jgi:emfourin
MRITLERHGGLAAGVRRRPRVVDTGALAPEAARELARLVAEAKAAAPPPGGSGSGGAARRAPDAMGYTITVEEDGQPPAVLRGSDADMPDAFAALLDRLEEHAGEG